MIELFSRDELARLERRRKCGVALTIASLLAGVLVCAALCRASNVLTEARSEIAVIAVGVLSGWLAVGFWTLMARDAKHEAEHAGMILAGERAAVPGKVTVTRERLRIRGSITIRKVEAADGKTTRKLNVNERKAKALAAAGEGITLYAVNGYVAAYETQTPPAAPPRTPLHARLWRKFFAQLPFYLVCLVLGAILWSWIFGLATDTTPEKKVTIFVDAYAVEDARLSAALERDLPEGIRMVRAHPMSYVMFDDAALRSADLFILPASRAADFDELLAQTPDASADAADVLARGEKIYDAAKGSGAAQTYIQYALPGQTPEDYYLFIGANSPHAGEHDGAAYEIIAQLKELP